MFIHQLAQDILFIIVLVPASFFWSMWQFAALFETEDGRLKPSLLICGILFLVTLLIAFLDWYVPETRVGQVVCAVLSGLCFLGVGVYSFFEYLGTCRLWNDRQDVAALYQSRH